MDPKWLDWAKRLQALSQNGLVYTTNPFDIDRYKCLRDIASEIMAENSDLEKDEMAALFREQEGYATPKVDLRGVVIEDGKVLMVKERLDGKWTLPGGWADTSESPSEGAVREVWEESGYETKAVRLLAVYDRSKHDHWPPFPFHVYKMFVLCELTGGEAKTSIETTDVGWFPEDGLPELSTSRILEPQIRRMFELARTPGLPPDLD